MAVILTTSALSLSIETRYGRTLSSFASSVKRREKAKIISQARTLAVARAVFRSDETTSERNISVPSSFDLGPLASTGCSWFGILRCTGKSFRLDQLYTGFAEICFLF